MTPPLGSDVIQTIMEADLGTLVVLSRFDASITLILPIVNDLAKALTVDNLLSGMLGIK